ncbi:MAG TPA: hypothetical protein VMD97_03735 [Candidatus Aquilonibacter sp.]|nr:hypothetical protein [Candidatus Aquilonibacter sp.]
MALSADNVFAQKVESSQRVLLVVAALAVLFWTAIYFQFSIDDAYISYRYGKTLIAHHIWNWNPSGIHEEAYTSAVYTALSVIPAALRVSPALFFKCVGLLCVFGMGYRLYTQPRSRFACLVGFLLLACDPWVWLHCYSGLETPLYMLLILEMALSVERAATVAPEWVYLLALVLPLTRPEGILFSVVGVWLYWRRRGTLPKHWRSLAATILLGLLYFVARWKYFHQLLPNPFYVKVDHDSVRAVLDHIADNFSMFRGFLLVLILILCIARKPVTRVFTLCALALIVLLVFPHNMPMNYADRYIFQVSLPVVLLFLIAEDVTEMARVATVIVAVFLVALSPAEMIYGVRYFPSMLRAHVDIGKRLAPFAANHTILAGDVGVIPYYSDWVTYDFAGLATGSIARHGLDEASLERMRPDLIILYNAKPGPGLLVDHSWVGPEPAASTIVQYIRDSGDYVYAASSRANHFYLVEFVRKDTPQFAQIVATLQQNSAASDTASFSIKDLLLQRYVPWSK